MDLTWFTAMVLEFDLTKLEKYDMSLPLLLSLIVLLGQCLSPCPKDVWFVLPPQNHHISNKLS